MMGRFRHLKVALAFVLLFIGVKMLLHDVYVLPNLISLAVILGAVTIGVLASLLGDKPAEADQHEHGPDPAKPS
jgi:tellurite resistance protein TerC